MPIKAGVITISQISDFSLSDTTSFSTDCPGVRGGELLPSTLASNSAILRLSNKESGSLKLSW